MENANSNSSSLVHQAKDVVFEDVSYAVSVRKSLLKFNEVNHRKILHGVSGIFRSGQLTAIMGPSGAGKSSLLNAISGYITNGVSGHISLKREYSCYITQEDSHQTLLSVEELMKLSCDLKLKRSKRIDRELLINQILENLHLNHRRKITADKLSGGERKRLSIALELVANPSVFFLDEPTSGLDEVTAAQCVNMLRDLAHQGHTVVCTIHQPSARIFNYFDNIYVLARGHCVYQGKPQSLIPYLKHVKMECPIYYSPPDYIIELCEGDDSRKNIHLLTDLTENGKLIYEYDINFRPAINTLFTDNSAKSDSNLQSLMSPSFITDGSLISGVTAVYNHMRIFAKKACRRSSNTSVSGLRQFVILFRLMMLKIMRGRIALFIQFFHHLSVGLFFGLIFLGLGNKGERMFDHLKYCIGCILMMSYTQVMVPVLSYPPEVKLVKKEIFNRWYGLTPYYAALSLSRIPMQLFFNLIFLSIAYYMTGLPLELWRFCIFASTAQMTSLVAEGMGLAIGGTFSITNGSAIGPMIIAPFMGLACYGFDFAAQISDFMNLIMKVSFIRVGVVAMVLSVFGFDRPDLDCDDMYCHFSDPKVLLRFLDIEKTTITHQFTLLFLLMVLFRSLLYISLRRRCVL